ncbi:PQQ-dependent sugar dehydrogenase [Mariniflexile sp. HNIBRBA6329]|uniref:PQQ-dependent sugar dehydrogenase n=1 Tax=Mariniflexile sp. HNIBRBA6329 TaxID=3373088 RepID=UPI003746AFAB
MKTKFLSNISLHIIVVFSLLSFTAPIFAQGTLAVTANGNPINSGTLPTTTNTDNLTDFGNVQIGANKQNIFVLDNTATNGNPSDQLTGIQIAISGSSDFATNTASLGDLKGNATPLNHTITFTPTSTGVKTAHVTITFTTGTNSPYTFTIQGTGVLPTPEINITGKGNTIASGDGSPSTTDGTNFGTIATGTSFNQQFIIQNTVGNTTLALTGSPIVNITGDSEFSIAVQPASNSINGVNSLNFSVEYNPLTDGTHAAIISIDNNDSNENPYTFTVQGTSVSPAPEINVTGNGSSIADGDLYPSTFNNTNFGSVNIGNTSTKVYNIYNTGVSPLNISDISLSNTTDFQIVGTPYSASVSPGGNTQFSIRYTGTSGKHSSTVTIESDDSDEGTYTFVIRGSSKATGDTGLWTVTNITANSQLNNPYEITYFTDGYLWVTERTNKKIVRVNSVGTGNTKADMINLSGSVYQTGGQDGLMGMAIHPDLMANPGTATNNYVYVAYTFSSNGADSGRKLRIARLLYNNTTKTLAVDTSLDANGKIIEIPHASNDHNSGRLIIGPDLKLYYTIGDQGANQFGNACNPIESQSLPSSPSDYSVYKGKVLRLNLDGTVPSDNPSLNGVKSHVYTYGHRNTQGIIFGSNGKLYASEHGAKVDDELNIVTAGKNYGWPHIAGYYDNLAYSYCNWSSTPGGCSSGGFTDHNCPSGVTSVNEFNPVNNSLLSNFQPPIGTYDSTTNYDPSGGWLTWPTVAPSSIDIYEGGLIPNWGSSLLITTLKEGTIFRAKLNTSGDALVDITTDNKFEEFHSSNDRYRDLAMDPDGITFYAITDSQGTTSGPSGSSSVTLSNPGVIMKFTYIGTTGTTYYVDADGDGFGDINDTTGTQFPSDPGTGYSLTNDDCDDSDDTIYPDAPAPAKTNCWDNFVFNAGTCSWDNNGTQPTEPVATNCWDDYQFDTDTCAWINEGTQPTEPVATNCWDDYQFDTNTCAWINEGTQPTEPAATNCWDDYQFDTDTCAWINEGTQPTEPAATNCWDDYQFDTDTCAWINEGTQPTEPVATNCWDDYQFDTDTCAWINEGTQPTEPVATNCWETTNFNNTTCEWEVSGTPNTYFADTDKDGFGDPNNTILDCTTPTGYVTDNTDCDDNDANTNPGSTEIPGNSIDDDCNPATLDGVLEINDFNLEYTLITPNPFNDAINIKLPLSYNNSKFDIKVFDLNGRLVFSKKYDNINGIINVSGLSKLEQAPYLIELTSIKTGISIRKRLIKF